MDKLKEIRSKHNIHGIDYINDLENAVKDQQVEIVKWKRFSDSYQREAYSLNEELKEANTRIQFLEGLRSANA